MFAGSCIGVVCLVCVLEFLRRLSREYDRYIALSADRSHLMPTKGTPRILEMNGSDRKDTSPGTTVSATEGTTSRDGSDINRGLLSGMRQSSMIKPTLPQQMIRAVLHMLQFGVGYFVMLLAMYYNGYIIICILLGALIGAFAFSWDTVASVSTSEASGCCCG